MKHEMSERIAIVRRSDQTDINNPTNHVPIMYQLVTCVAASRTGSAIQWYLHRREFGTGSVTHYSILPYGIDAGLDTH